MSQICLTPFEYASRDIGIAEVAGTVDNPAILAMLRLDAGWPEHDETPWCSAWLNQICHRLRLPRSKSLAARSWLDVGTPIDLSDGQADADVLILTRAGASRDPNVRNAPGHVGLFAGWAPAEPAAEGSVLRPFSRVLILGGNQGNRVSIAAFDADLVIGARRLN